MRNKKHLQLLQLEKQRFENARLMTNEWQYRSFKFSIEQPAKSKTKLIILVIVAVSSIFFSQWSIISEVIASL